MKPNAGADKTKTIKAAIRMAAYLLAVMLVFSAISVLCSTDTVVFRATEPGVTDLTDFDFDKEIAQVATASTNSIFMYPGAFYSPQDFADGEVSVDGVLYGNEGTYSQGEYGTLRMVLMLPQDEVYAIAGKNVSYAQRLFIDGKEYTPIGVPGDSAEAVTPKTTRYVEGFRPTGDTTEIIIHYSNFVYADGGGLYPLDIGLVQNVARNEQLRVFYITTVTAALITAALFFFGLFLFFPKGRYLLWFALICVCVALRGLLTSDKFIMLLLPNLDWVLAIRLEFTANCGIALFSALYLNGLFPGVANRWTVRGFTAFCASHLPLIFLTPPIFFTRYTAWLVGGYAVFVSCLLLAVLIAALRQKLASPLSGAEQVLLLFGLVVYVALSVWGIYAHQNSLSLWGLDYPQVGMIVFLFLNILALDLGFARTESELDVSRRAEREMEETNRLLARLNRVKSKFLENISHEMKTPLTIMGGYAGVALKQIKMNAVNDKTVEILDIVQHEALRLGRMVERLKEVAMEKERQLTLTDTDAGTLLTRATDACTSLCRENKNKLVIHTGREPIPLRVDTDGIHQVLINLIGNASRHTHGGIITLSTEREPGNGAVVLTVSDNGEGIDPAIMDRVFERSFSSGGSTGLGLVICKEIVEEHGGKIGLQSEKGKGTAVRFTLLVSGEAEQV